MEVIYMNEKNGLIDLTDEELITKFKDCNELSSCIKAELNKRGYILEFCKQQEKRKDKVDKTKRKMSKVNLSQFNLEGKKIKSVPDNIELEVVGSKVWYEMKTCTLSEVVKIRMGKDMSFKKATRYFTYEGTSLYEFYKIRVENNNKI